MYGSKFSYSSGMLEAVKNVMTGTKVFEKNGIKVEIPKEISTESAQDFIVKAAAAKKAGKKEFEFGGKTFPVTIKLDPDKVTEAMGKDSEKKKEDKVEVNPEVEIDEGVQDKKAVAAMKAMLDGMSKKDAIAKFGVSPKKLDQLRKSMFGEAMESMCEKCGKVHEGSCGAHSEGKGPGIADLERKANDYGLSKKDIATYKKVADMLAKEKK